MTDQVPVPGEPDFPALALANSRHNSRAGVVDRLVTPQDLSEWLAERSLARAGMALGGRELEAAHRLRDAIRELLLARIEGRVPEPGAVAAINEATAAAPAADQLQWDAPAAPVRTRLTEGAGQAERAFAALAEDAIALVSGERHRDLAACHAPGCVRLLLKDHPRREWCSTRCGDRVRAARYYRRHRAG